jgi:integrase
MATLISNRDGNRRIQFMDPRRPGKRGMVAASSFEELTAGSQQNPDRSFYVSPEVIAAMLDRCPGVFWRLMVALGRYAGLRIPSEVTSLTWDDVASDTGRLMVRSPKTARHEGHAVRLVPICPELRGILAEAYEQAADGEKLILPRALTGASNLRTTFTKIITRAGHEPWRRLFQNLRASCATDWVEKYPNHVVAKWLGHSPMIAATHYLQAGPRASFRGRGRRGRAGDPRPGQKECAHLCAVKSRRNQQRLARSAATQQKTRDRAKRCESLRAEENSVSGRRGTRTPNPLGVNEVL